jgi:hypothetical protein
MRLGLKPALVIAVVLMSSFVSAQSSQTGDTKSAADLWYLLVRRAGHPERNYYELSRRARFLEPQLFSDEIVRRYHPSPKSAGFDIETDRTVRYGVYQVWKVRVVGTSDTGKVPASTKDAVYVLIYSRHPDWIFCAKKYRATSANAGTTIIYTDFQDGREYTFAPGPKWPRPWQVYEIDPVRSSALVEIWQASKHPTAEAATEYSGQDSEMRNDSEFRLRATVQAVALLADFSGTAIPVDIDPRFALTVKIKSAIPEASDFRPGVVVTFAIHSPSLLFGGEPTVGKAYDFMLDRSVEDGKVRFSGLRELEEHKE